MFAIHRKTKSVEKQGVRQIAFILPKRNALSELESEKLDALIQIRKKITGFML